MSTKIILIFYRYILILGLIASSYFIGSGNIGSGILGILSFISLLVHLDYVESKKIKNITDNDKRVCREIKDVMDVDFIDFFKKHDFGAPFHSGYSDKLRKVIIMSENVHYSFDDEDIEKKRRALNKSAKKLIEALIKYTMTNDAGFQGVKIGVNNIDYDKIRRESEEINRLAEDFSLCCEDMVITCNRKCG